MEGYLLYTDIHINKNVYVYRLDVRVKMRFEQTTALYSIGF